MASTAILIAQTFRWGKKKVIPLPAPVLNGRDNIHTPDTPGEEGASRCIEDSVKETAQTGIGELSSYPFEPWTFSFLVPPFTFSSCVPCEKFLTVYGTGKMRFYLFQTGKR